MLRSLLNQRLGRYFIKELLGRGGMAAVYRAADTILQRDIALKVLYPQYSDDASQVERFKREAVTAASLEHPSIVPVYDVGEQDGMVYIAMKLLSGRTLQERLQEAGSIGLEELIVVLEPVAAALDYAHARGVIHRDIKPGNIFLSQESEGSRPLLTDFGIAKQLDTPGLTTTGALIGTPDYMAPEQIAGRALGPQADVYALGMLAFRSLTGRRAFEGATQDVLLGHLYGRAPLVSELNPALPPGIDDVIAAAIAPDPAARFPSAGAFALALRAVARGATAATAVGVTPALQGVGAPLGDAHAQASTGVGTPPAGVRLHAARSLIPPPQAADLPMAATAQVVRGGPPAPGPTAQAGASSPRADGVTAGRELARQPVERAPALQRGGGSGPWLLAVLLALVAGGLAVALAFAVGGQGAAGAGTPAPPPSATATLPPTATATAAPASPTADPAAVVTGTAAATATPEAPSPTVRPPTAIVVPPTVAPPTRSATPSATLTPEPPSPTPTLTATATPTPTLTATATPTPTLTATATPTPAVVAGCPEDLMEGGFAQVYADQVTVRRGLGCPLDPQVAGAGAQQAFEEGIMFWWSGKNGGPKGDYIFALMGLSSGAYEEFSADDVAALGPEPTPGTDPYAPRRGFGRVYYYRADIGEALGMWTSPEIELKGGSQSAVTQLFEQGMMIWTPIEDSAGRKSVFVLYNDGTFERYDDPFAG